MSVGPATGWRGGAGGLLLGLVLGLAACTATVTAPPAATGNCGASEDTLKVMSALQPTCAGCHSGGNRGYFASPAAFQSLLVADPTLVVPGQPDQSALVQLLEGKSDRAFKQMPPAGLPYAQLAARDPSMLGVEAIRSWITNLPAQARDPRPDRAAVRVTRMSATQIQRALYQQLGLTPDDFFVPGYEFGIEKAVARSDDIYPLQSRDAVPAPFESTSAQRFEGLGGGSVHGQVQPSRDPSPTFVLTLTQVSQSWCRLAIAKPGNTALFPAGSASSTTEAEVRATIARWSLHFLAEPASPEEVDRLYAKLFLPLVVGLDPEPAYVGLCSYFVRHPHWVVY